MVELDKKYNPHNTGTEIDQNLLNSLPLPIYDAYKLLENQSDYEKSLQVLCLSLIPWTYQYIALIFSGEYLASEHEPSSEVTDSLINMIKKPGPGKWIGFTRIASGYFMDHKASVISPELISILNTILNEKGKPQVKISENDNKLEYSDALINIRNRFAHSRNFSGDKAKELFQDYFQIWKAWIVIIREVFEPRLLFRSSPGNPFQSFDNRPFDIKNIPPDNNKNTTLLWDEKRETYIRLYPIIVTTSEDSKKNGEVAFLEEIKSKYLFYLQGDNFFKLKDEFEVLSKMIESKTIIEEEVSAGSLTLRTFAERIDRITSQTINNFQDALKYIPEMYVDRPSFTATLDSWLDGNLPGCIIAGNQGTGKTSIIANWCIHRKTKGDHVLLFEASGLKDSDITLIIERELNLSSPLRDCLDTILKQNSNISGEQKPEKFIIVIDAVNEFTGKNNENRSRLWREINSLVSSLNLYIPYIKCLVTTRSDLWSVDFPEKNSAYDMLKEKLYWGDAENGFPRVSLGDLTLAEAGEIFENARKTIPSMAVQNSFGELSEKTQKVLCNPFLLRLALLIYNERKMPGLTKSKIEKQYARERITEEKDKKTVLFVLLERMSELRKTEITFDEFLYTKAKTKLIKQVSEKEKENLEKLIFDPRPQSPYKKLIKEGIIEERAENENNLESKEKIRFSQEKITDIIYSEFQQRSLKHVKKWLIIGLISVIPILGISFFGIQNSIKKDINNIQTELNKSTPDHGDLVQITNISSAIIKESERSQTMWFAIELIFIYCVLWVITFLAVYLRFYLSKISKNDLPSRFIKEKFMDLNRKYTKNKLNFVITMLLMIAPILYMVFLEHTKPLSEVFMPYLYCGLFLGFSLQLWSIIRECIVVIRNANSPHDAFCMFGPKEVFPNLIIFLTTIPFIILIYFGPSQIHPLWIARSNERMEVLKQEWISNEAVNSLNQSNPKVYLNINNTLQEIVKKQSNDTIKETISQSYSLLRGKVIIYGFLIAFPIALILRYFAGFWLFKLLKRRL
jgi:hypothetical protein